MIFGVVLIVGAMIVAADFTMHFRVKDEAGWTPTRFNNAMEIHRLSIRVDSLAAACGGD